MTPRYTRQHHKYDCVPAALVNALKWAGKSISYREEKRNLFEATKCRREIGGVSYWDANNAVVRGGKEFFSTTIINNPYLEEIEEHLAGEGAVILSFLYIKENKKLCRHLIFMPGISPDGTIFQAIWGGRIVDIPRGFFHKRYLRFRRKTNPTVAYLLTKI